MRGINNGSIARKRAGELMFPSTPHMRKFRQRRGKKAQARTRSPLPHVSFQIGTRPKYWLVIPAAEAKFCNSHAKNKNPRLRFERISESTGEILSRDLANKRMERVVEVSLLGGLQKKGDRKKNRPEVPFCIVMRSNWQRHSPWCRLCGSWFEDYGKNSLFCQYDDMISMFRLNPSWNLSSE